MKYSLRSLMIVVTLVATCIGVVTGWWNHRRFCREQAFKHVKASAHAFYDLALRADTNLTSEEKKLLGLKNDYHTRLANAYDHAVWRPWERMWIDESPPEGMSP